MMVRIAGLVAVFALALPAFAQTQQTTPPETTAATTMDMGMQNGMMLRDLCEVYIRLDQVVMDLEGQQAGQPMGMPEPMTDDTGGAGVGDDTGGADVATDTATDTTTEPGVEVGTEGMAMTGQRCQEFEQEFRQGATGMTDTTTDAATETTTDTETTDTETMTDTETTGTEGMTDMMGQEGMTQALSELRMIHDRLGQIIDQLEAQQGMGMEGGVTGTEGTTDDTGGADTGGDDTGGGDTGGGN